MQTRLLQILNTSQIQFTCHNKYNLLFNTNTVYFSTQIQFTFQHNTICFSTQIQLFEYKHNFQEAQTLPPAFLPLHLVNESWHDINLKMKHHINRFDFRNIQIYSCVESLWECVPKLNSVMLAIRLEHTWYNVAHQGGWTDERPCLMFTSNHLRGSPISNGNCWNNN